MLRVEALQVDIGATNILRDARLAVAPGTMCGLIGRNGAGKTTFMRSVMGLLPARSGQVRIDGQDVGPVPAHRRAGLGIGYMPEDRRLVPDFTGEENILATAWATGAGDSAERLRWIYGLMPEVAQFAQRRASQLSGGQQKLAALARALMSGRKLLLLDEPFEGVAPALARRLAEVLSDLKGEGLSILLAESNERHVADLLDSIYSIERGSIGPAAKAAAKR
jgi:branched-chain amino acid transport system ATP-binding protein